MTDVWGAAQLRHRMFVALADGALTASELAALLRVRRASVDAVLKDRGFEHAETPDGGSRRAVYWQAAPGGVDVSGRVLSQAEALLDALADGEWHSSASLYRVATVLPARVRELRRRGYPIEIRRVGRTYDYRLVRDEEA